MIFRYLNNKFDIIKQKNISFIIKSSVIKEIWLFNCIEGCQFYFFYHKLKINNLSKIIISNLHINNISGLLGLLSTLNLIGRIRSLHIYAPIDLKYYLDLGKKYSKTNFSYIIYIHSLQTGLIINQYSFRIYAFNNYDSNQYEFIITESEQYGMFLLNKAIINYLSPGLLYAELKKGDNFLFPDGVMLDGESFTSIGMLGNEVCMFLSCFYKRRFFENTLHNRIILF
uniref:Rnz n=1 Tax=Harveyella mirabilis TaxID=282355 RepID=A0A3S8UW55_9FLOR|nr:Rnz [Harveyella mirabilis]